MSAITKVDINGTLYDIHQSKTAANGGTDLSLVTTGEKYTWNNKQDALSFMSMPSSSNKVATANDIPSSLPARNQIASYTAISSNTSAVTTSLTEDGAESKIYYNNGSSTVTVSFATSGLIFVDGNDSMEIPAGRYGEVNFLRITTSNTTRIFVRSVVSE